METLQPLIDAEQFFKGRNVEIILELGDDSTWSKYFEEKGYLVEMQNPGPDLSGDVFDAAVAPLTLDTLSPRQMAMTIEGLAQSIRRGGSLSVLFHPYNPEVTTDRKWTLLTNNQIKHLFIGFTVVDFYSYSGGYRGLLLKRNGNS